MQGITAAINAAIAPDSVANINADTGAYIWLKDNSAANVAVSFSTHSCTLLAALACNTVSVTVHAEDWG